MPRLDLRARVGAMLFFLRMPYFALKQSGSANSGENGKRFTFAKYIEMAGERKRVQTVGIEHEEERKIVCKKDCEADTEKRKCGIV